MAKSDENHERERENLQMMEEFMVITPIPTGEGLG